MLEETSKDLNLCLNFQHNLFVSRQLESALARLFYIYDFIVMTITCVAF